MAIKLTPKKAQKNTKRPLKSANTDLAKFRKEVRRCLADYIKSEGCGCCGNREEHNVAMNQLGKLLKMKKYKDGSGYDYTLYLS